MSGTNLCSLKETSLVSVFQQFRPEKTLDPAYNTVKPHPSETIEKFTTIMENYVDKVDLRI